MFVNLNDAVAVHNVACAAWNADYLETLARVKASGLSLAEAHAAANTEVIGRRGELPTIAKAIHDQGGPISGGSV